eukprot:COSAG02_NODE_706_length_18259_cov_10.340253_12_plen_173_part_00
MTEESPSQPRTSTSLDLESLEPIPRRAGPRVSFYYEAPETESEETSAIADNRVGVGPRESIMSSASAQYLAEVAPFLCSASPEPSVDAETHAEQLANFFAAVSPPPPSVSSTDQRTEAESHLVIERLQRQVAELELCAHPNAWRFASGQRPYSVANPLSLLRVSGIETATVA